MAKARPMPYLTANVQHHHAGYAAGGAAPQAKTVRVTEHHNAYHAKWPPPHFLRPTANTVLNGTLTLISWVFNDLRIWSFSRIQANS